MPSNVKITLGKFSPRDYNLPDFTNTMTHTPMEMLMIFGRHQAAKDLNFRQVMGVGIVRKISHGEKFDLVYMRFGTTKKIRRILVVDNHARRQILTLKKGSFATFVGYGRIYTIEYTNAQGETKKKPTWVFWALGFQTWYVPTMVDIKRDSLNENEDIEQMDSDDQELGIDILDQFEKSKGENL